MVEQLTLQQWGGKMETLKKVFKSKTVLFGLLLTLASIAEMYVQFLPKELVGPVGVTIGAVTIFLRFLTTVPLDEK